MFSSLFPANVPELGCPVGRHVTGMSGGHHDSDSLRIPLLWAGTAKEESFPAASGGVSREALNGFISFPQACASCCFDLPSAWRLIDIL